MGAIKYFITVESETPPAILLGEKIGGAVVVSLQTEELPRLVDTAWLLERFNLSKSTLISKLSGHNKGTGGKHMYDPKIVMPLLSGDLSETKRGRKRIN